MSTNKRIIWSDGKVFSIALRNGQFALLQMVEKIVIARP